MARIEFPGSTGTGSGTTTPSQVVLPPDTLANRPAAATDGRLFICTTNGIVYRDNGSLWVAEWYTTTITDGKAAKAGDTFTGPVAVQQSATAALVTLKDTDDITAAYRVGLWNDGRLYSIGSDNSITGDGDAVTAAVPFNAATDPQVFINHTRPGATGNGTALRVRGSKSSTNTQLFALEDYLGSAIIYVPAAGGLFSTDAIRCLYGGTTSPTDQLGFFYRNTNGSGAVTINETGMCVAFGQSPQQWTGDLVPAAKQLGNYMSHGYKVVQVAITSGSPTATIVSGLNDATTLRIGSTKPTIRNAIGSVGIPASTLVNATPSSTTITMSNNATATGTIYAVIVDMNILEVHAYEGVEYHGNDGSGTTAFGRIVYNLKLIIQGGGKGLVLSGDADEVGWQVHAGDKHFNPPNDNTNDIGNGGARLRNLYAVNVGTVGTPVTVVNATTVRAPTANVTSLVGTDGVSKDVAVDVPTLGLTYALARGNASVFAGIGG